MARTTFKWTLCLFSFFLSYQVMAQAGQSESLDESDPNATIKAYYLFFFAKYADWPSEAKTGEFVIAVYGNAEVFDELLLKYATQQIGSQRISIVYVEQISDLKNTPHLLFVGRSKSEDLKSLAGKYSSDYTMLVSHDAKAMSHGAMANFKVIDSAIRYEINETLARKKKITIGNKLLQFAVNP